MATEITDDVNGSAKLMRKIFLYKSLTLYTGSYDIRKRYRINITFTYLNASEHSCGSNVTVCWLTLPRLFYIFSIAMNYFTLKNSFCYG